MTRHPFPLKPFAVAALTGLALMTAPAAAQQCGGDFQAFLAGVKQEAVAKGLSASAADQTLSGAQIDRKVLSRDRAQGVFKMTFLDFSKRVISSYRMKNGAANMQKYASVFDRVEREYGVPAPVITAFWALETDFGAVQGDFNTVNALATLAHDCRRPELFRPQLIAAIEMVQHGDLDPRNTTGAWAGEIGMVQMLPEDIIKFGKDADGDGHVRLKASAPDAILTAGAFINHLGWRDGEPWLQEVTRSSKPELGRNRPWQNEVWQRLGRARRSAALGANFRELACVPPVATGPQGSGLSGVSELQHLLGVEPVVHLHDVGGLLRNALAGAPRYDAGNPDQGLNDAQMKQLQTKLSALGYDVGKIDGILGAGTRGAVQQVQQQLGMPADAWPTPALLNKL
jgi:lytic murein transglycosylase